MWGFPGGPLVKTLPCSARGWGLNPGQGVKIPHASWPKNQNINNRINIVTKSIRSDQSLSRVRLFATP